MKQFSSQVSSDLLQTNLACKSYVLHCHLHFTYNS